jgi:tetratricopeptide (TPR) repeat protein
LVNLPERGNTIINMDAYELYLKGRGLVARRKEADLFQAIDILKSAIEIEPQYAQAMATLAKAYAVLPWFSREIPAGEARETARRWTEKALVLEPENTEALAVLAIVYTQNDMNFTGARKLLDSATKSNPGSVAANNFLGDLCIRTGDLDCALIHESRAAELDPLGPVQLTDLANVYLIRGQYDKTIQLAERALTLDPSFTNAHAHLFTASFLTGNDKRLASLLQELGRLRVFPEDRINSFQFLHDVISGHQERALKDLSRRAGLAASGVIPAVVVAYDAAAIEDYDTAGNMLLKAYESKDGTWLFPVFIRLPEQAPDSAPWQKFWSLPGVAELAELRRKNGLKPFPDEFNSGVNP